MSECGKDPAQTGLKQRRARDEVMTPRKGNSLSRAVCYGKVYLLDVILSQATLLTVRSCEYAGARHSQRFRVLAPALPPSWGVTSSALGAQYPAKPLWTGHVIHGNSTNKAS